MHTSVVKSETQIRVLWFGWDEVWSTDARLGIEEKPQKHSRDPDQDIRDFLANDQDFVWWFLSHLTNKEWDRNRWEQVLRWKRERPNFLIRCRAFLEEKKRKCSVCVQGSKQKPLEPGEAKLLQILEEMDAS